MCDSRWRLVYRQADSIDRAMRDVDSVQALLSPYPADEMVAYPVSPRVNNPAYDPPEGIAAAVANREGTGKAGVPVARSWDLTGL